MTPLQRPATTEGLFLWVMHRFAQAFGSHAILKGGMALRLVDSPRSTTDIDYVFVQYDSKKQVRREVETLLDEIDGAVHHITMNSKALVVDLRVDDAAIQIEANVMAECGSTAMATGGFARALGQPSRIVRIMSFDQALAHKIAAWNERRLPRDLYDCYFLVARLGEMPDRAILERRLRRIESRLPAMRQRRQMTASQLATEMHDAVEKLSQQDLRQQLAPILPEEELAGLLPRIKAAITKLVEFLHAD